MTQDAVGGQNIHQRGGGWEQVPDRALAQTEDLFWWADEDEAARVEEEAEAEALAEAEAQLLRQIDEEQLAEEEADFGWFPFNDPFQW